MGKIVLVTGGARSGKSSFAEKYVGKYGKKIAYIATAQAFDEEMKFRIALHRQRRPSAWHTYEAPKAAHLAIKQAGTEGCDMILFDCLTVYISNLLCAMENIEDSQKNYRMVQENCQALIQAAQAENLTLVLVTNEVGGGIVPENHLAREFRDLAGLANQLMAQAAAEVYLVTAGIPVDVKKLAVEL